MEDIEEKDINEEEINEKEEAFSPPEFRDLQSLQERWKNLACKVIDEMRCESLEETLVKLRHYKTTLSQLSTCSELLEKDAMKKSRWKKQMRNQ